MATKSANDDVSAMSPNAHWRGFARHDDGEAAAHPWSQSGASPPVHARAAHRGLDGGAFVMIVATEISK